MKQLRHSLLCILSIFTLGSATGQILSVEPIFPTTEDTVTIVYNANEGNGELVGVSPVYAHAGVITTTSTSPSDWKYVQGNWGSADPNTLMTDLGNGLHQIKYHIRSYYGVPANEDVVSLAFVFRNADGSKVGRSSDGSDIYYQVYNGGVLETAFLEPENSTVYEIGDSIKIKVAASDSASLELTQNGNPVATANGKALEYAWQANTAGDYWMTLSATNGDTTVMDSILVVVRGDVVSENVPAGSRYGINYLNDSTVRLVLHAPYKNYVYVLGDFNDWQPSSAYYMKRSIDQFVYWIDLQVTPGQEYAFQYLVNGSLRIADPYTDKVLDPWNDSYIPASVYPNLKEYPTGKTTGIVSTFQTAQTEYAWQHPVPTRPAPEDLVVYEMLVRDFVATHSYQTLIDTLDYLESLGVNAIELMPIMEFEGNNSWGYNPSYLFAVDKYYGTKDDLKAFIDACHARGMVVLLDMVINHHFGQSPLVQLYWDAANNRPSPASPWFNPIAKHPFNVGYDMNHESQAVKDYSDRILAYWVEEFRFDGFRMDLSKGFTQTDYGNDVGAWSNYDAGRIALLKRMFDQLRTVDPSVYFVLEHFANNTEEKELAEYGMLIWGNLNHAYTEGAMGYNTGSNSDFSWIAHTSRGWSVPHAIGYMESHDEERMMFKAQEYGNGSGSYQITELETALDRAGMAATFFLTIPGPKMIWQFGEMGYDISIDQNGRTGEKPILWNYLDVAERKRLFKVYAALLHLRADESVFRSGNMNFAVSGDFKRIKLDDPTMNVVIIGNFGTSSVSGNPDFHQTGMWYDFFTGDSIDITQVNQQISLAPGEYHLYTDRKLNTPDISLSQSPLFQQVSLGAFPNPFSDALHVHWTQPEGAEVSAELYDLTGRRLQVLHEGWMAPGDQMLQWQAGEELPVGTYLVRIQSNGWTSTIKAVKTR
ncbi:alpha-amylase family glycosyl hydrolase [Pontibacter sp. G13]|uniref:DUF4961 domain-containing protein n=1 Tax=Pontibacter sp. G13 TaxID=3074898 RepID=UPI00288908C1|nr:alpha-amylase family glycosyl hydrolase [Pontibacter sp. G13]WNJ19240.1 alpha-amylase family glycosyl hydrolase [Pontibacter sp. G13]